MRVQKKTKLLPIKLKTIYTTVYVTMAVSSSRRTMQCCCSGTERFGPGLMVLFPNEYSARDILALPEKLPKC